jgi:hypothetical protein
MDKIIVLNVTPVNLAEQIAFAIKGVLLDIISGQRGCIRHGFYIPVFVNSVNLRPQIVGTVLSAQMDFLIRKNVLAAST